MLPIKKQMRQVIFAAKKVDGNGNIERIHCGHNLE